MTECIAVQVPELLVTVVCVSGLFWYVAVRAWSLRVGENMSFSGSSMERILSLVFPKRKESPRTVHLELMGLFCSCVLTQEGPDDPYFKQVLNKYGEP